MVLNSPHTKKLLINNVIAKDVSFTGREYARIALQRSEKCLSKKKKFWNL